MILAVFASMCGTVGKQLIRFSEVQRQRNTKAALYGAKISMVLALSLMTVIGPLIDMGSYAFAPQSLIAPLGALDVVWNTLLAPFTLGESLNRLLIGGCVLIAGGAVATSLIGTHEDGVYTLDQMKDMFIRWQVLLYLLVLFAWVSFNVLGPMRLSAGPEGAPFLPGNKLRGLSLGLTAGSIAGNMFCVKGFVELLQASISNQDGDIWVHWMPYAMLVGAVFFALSNLYFLTTGMREYEALFMGSIFEGSLIFFACLSGGIVFKEFEVLKPYEFVLYCMALAGIVGGIAAVAKGSTSDTDEVSEVQPQGETNTSPVEEQTHNSEGSLGRQVSSNSSSELKRAPDSSSSQKSQRSSYFRQSIPETMLEFKERAARTSVTAAAAQGSPTPTSVSTTTPAPAPAAPVTNEVTPITIGNQKEPLREEKQTEKEQPARWPARDMSMPTE